MVSPNLFSKEWGQCLTEDRDPQTDPDYDISFVKRKRALGADGTGINIFLRDVDDSALCQIDEVEEFCPNTNLRALESGKGSSGCRRVAWLDDRNFSQNKVRGDVRQYCNPLTATKLYHLLNKPVIAITSFCIAKSLTVIIIAIWSWPRTRCRQTCHVRSASCHEVLAKLPLNALYSYIPNLDRNYIHALAETAPFHQTEALRDALHKHLALQTAIQVHVCVQSYHLNRPRSLLLNHTID